MFTTTTRIASTFTTALAATALAATAALAAGGDSSTPPTPTETTTKCAKGQIFDADSGTCVKVEANNVNDDMRYDAARELAYAGQYDRAMEVLASAQNQDDPRILNYYGFTFRKLGNFDKAESFYLAAIDANPDYILARSYYGQGLVAKGDILGAWGQLKEISTREGEGTWAYASLEAAIQGAPTDY